MIADSNRAGTEHRVQDALRRVAALVARGVQPHEVFAAVAAEVAGVVDAPSVSVARYEPDGTVTVLGTFPPDSPRFPVGTRVTLEGNIVPSLVLERGEPARLDDFSRLEGELGGAARSTGMRSSVGVPIVAAGRTWGVIIASHTERLPESTEARLVDFTELLAAAIADTEGREALAQVSDEQAALRRVATLVAQGAQPNQLFATVAEEVGRVVDAPLVAIARYESEERATVYGTFPQEGTLYRTGDRVSLEGVSVLGRIGRDGRPARIDDYTDLEGEVAGGARRMGIRSGVGVPIVVAGRVWGSIVAWSTERLPEDFEARLADFTELLGAAISNAQATEALALLADEQAALRRVATLVAQDTEPAEIFAAVSIEVDRVFGFDPQTVDVAGVVRFAPGPEHVVVGVSKDVEAVPLGARFPPDELFAPTRVQHTGRSARVGEADLASTGGDTAGFLRQHGYLSQVASPIVVDGELWGAISVNSRKDFPPDTEERLGRFTELVATAIANAEARELRAQVAEEQAARRRVATLVAEGAAPAEVFAAVSHEIDRLLRLPRERARVCVVRFDTGPEHVVVGVSRTIEAIPLGSRWQTSDLYAPSRVLRTGRSARVREDELNAAGGPDAEFLRSNGYLSQVSSPIVVDGQLWGAISANSAEPLPADTEERLEKFIELTATAIANAESRKALRDLADEQAALRRVATLVAEGASTTRLAATVLEEVVAVLGAPGAWLLRYEADRTMSILAAINDPWFPVGSRWPLEGTSVTTAVFETGHSARIDDFTGLEGAIAERSRESGFRSSLGVPIVVDGTVWGAICVGTTEAEPLPPGTEYRLDRFTELVATAISNADAREHLSGLAEEQAALRRVATLVARAAPPEDVFNAVAMEVGKLLNTDITVVGRYDGNGAATATGSWSSSPGGVPVGTRSVLGGRNVLTQVAETGKPARMDGYDDASGEAADIARRHGWSSSIAAPIIVEGRMWGVMLVATQGVEPFPADAEQRLAAFTDLVATALANAQAHDAVRQFGEEQAALGHVATLVAAGSAPDQVFAAVVDEASSLLGLDRIELVRYDGDGAGTVVAASGDHPFPAGSTWSLDDPSVMAIVARTAHAARIDDYSTLSGEIARVARSAGFQSAIGAPVTVEGELWGAIIAISIDPEPISERSEARLGQFTELVATAVANAEARDAVARLADEQAALRRVATLVASGIRPDQLFAAVAKEVNELFGPEMAGVVRFEGGNTVVTVGGHGLPSAPGTRAELDPNFVVAAVRETGRAARFDTDDPTAADMPAIVRESRCVSAIASPIVVEGELWGVIVVGGLYNPLPADLEGRLVGFTDLIATAIANAESRDALAQLAQEQAALRRVATLVAEGAEPAAVFSAVGAEISRMLGASMSAVGRFEAEADGTALVIVGVGEGDTIPPGSRWNPDHLPPVAHVLRTEHSVRTDEIDWSAGGPVAEIARQVGVVSIVASPIFVEGRLWGVMTACDTKRLPLGAEERLEKFSELIATAIGNAESSAELAASRRRIVRAADEARRRIERDLHDGIQQRLIALTFRARTMTTRPADELPGIAAELSEGLKEVSDELREVSRGIYPTILTEAGLAPALRALARRSTTPIDVDVQLEERLPPQIEAAAYYIASEALANVTKHAQANAVRLEAGERDGLLSLEIRDDGVGGADADLGSGIVGLVDRAEALGGTITISSPPGAGTALSARLPLTT